MMQSRTYESTFVGHAGATLRAAFDDCEVSVSPGTTTLRAELPGELLLDRGAIEFTDDGRNGCDGTGGGFRVICGA